MTTQHLEAAKDAEPATIAANAGVLEELPFSDRQDFEDAQRGFIATLPTPRIKSGDPRVPWAWDLTPYEFLTKDQAPATVNPSLWRIAQLNMNHGLFQVADRVYQIRGFDLSNMDIIEGDTGLIIIDPLIAPETARAGLDLYYQHRPQKPVVAVIYTHSHIDHYAGVKGVVSEADVKAGKVTILAPEGFLEEAVSENVYAGNAMGRRALYMYGPVLPKGERGQVDGGLGKSTSFGVATLIPPTDTVTTTGETRTIDGVEMVFQMAPGTEAPAEMLIYFPQFRVLCTAEDATHTLHNVYTLRGAQVRNAKSWWKTLDETIELFGDQTDAVLAQHHWPMWEQQRIVTFLEKQRDLYKYIHDQSLRLANQGHTPVEIAEMIELPPSLAREWYNRDYYGSVSHNAKAVYQRYLGWYDSHPANLYPLPPEQAATKYVDFMGGAAAVIAKAKQSFDQGEYRWAAEVLKHVVFADPENEAAKHLQADALEQLGYQTENPTWRNEFLMGAFELRHGVVKVPIVTASPDTVLAMADDMLLDFMGIKLNGPKAWGTASAFTWTFPDSGGSYAVMLRDGVLVYTADKQLPRVDATVTWPRASIVGVLVGTTTLDQEVAAGRVTIDGDQQKVNELIGLLDQFDPLFNIVTP
jgi:alkyl sulfatase BDS1-like metallo-beta-lactamase superfamily hydrolase